MIITGSPLENLTLKEIGVGIDGPVKENVLRYLAHEATETNLPKVPLCICIDYIELDCDEHYDDEYDEEDKATSCDFKVFGHVAYVGAGPGRSFVTWCSYDYELKCFETMDFAVYFSDRMIMDVFDEDIRKRNKEEDEN